MQIRVRLFGNLAHYLPERSNTFSSTKILDEGTKVQHFMDELNIPEKVIVLVIVNGRRVSGDYVLRDGNEVNLFRPMEVGSNLNA